MARKSFKAGALSAPLPPVLVTVSDGERTNVLTVAWTGILATHPPRTYISVRPSRYSYEILGKNGEFVINLPSADMARTVDYVGIYTGKKIDKLEKCGLALAPSEAVSVPTLADCPIALECRVAEVLPMGTHDVFIADILSVSADEKIIDENGKLRFDRANLLAYAHGEYYALGEKLGEFGFSTKKERPDGGKGATASAPTGEGAKRKKSLGKKSRKENGAEPPATGKKSRKEDGAELSATGKDSRKDARAEPSATGKKSRKEGRAEPSMTGKSSRGKSEAKPSATGRIGLKKNAKSGVHARSSARDEDARTGGEMTIEAAPAERESASPAPFYVSAPGYKKRRGGRK